MGDAVSNQVFPVILTEHFMIQVYTPFRRVYNHSRQPAAGIFVDGDV
jgi:hypothetical protein